MNVTPKIGKLWVWFWFCGLALSQQLCQNGGSPTAFGCVCPWKFVGRFCQLRCEQGFLNSTTELCQCNEHFAGPACDIPCNEDNLTDLQTCFCSTDSDSYHDCLKNLYQPHVKSKSAHQHNTIISTNFPQRYGNNLFGFSAVGIIFFGSVALIVICCCFARRNPQVARTTRRESFEERQLRLRRLLQATDSLRYECSTVQRTMSGQYAGHMTTGNGVSNPALDLSSEQSASGGIYTLPIAPPSYEEVIGKPPSYYEATHS